MYGLVNKAIEDLVISSAGKEAWDKIKERAGLQELQMLDSSHYDDEITYSLVHAAAEILEQSAENILFAFGKHWVMYTDKNGWNNLFGATGDDLVSFLRGLDDMHARVNAAMPEGCMPEFTLIDKDGYFQFEYRSEREGLAPMVCGILVGLTEHFEEHWKIEHVDQKSQCGIDRFLLTRRDVHSVNELDDAA